MSKNSNIASEIDSKQNLKISEINLELQNAMIVIHDSLLSYQNGLLLFEQLEQNLSKNFKIMKSAINNGADINLKLDAQRRNFTPLMLTTFAGNLEMMNFLFNEGAALEEVDCQNNTLLHLAIGNRNPLVLFFTVLAIDDHPNKIFIANKANNAGKTALEVLLSALRDSSSEYDDFIFYSVAILDMLLDPISLKRSDQIRSYATQVLSQKRETSIAKVISGFVNYGKEIDILTSLELRIRSLCFFKSEADFEKYIDCQFLDRFIVSKANLSIEIAREAVERKNYYDANRLISILSDAFTKIKVGNNKDFYEIFNNFINVKDNLSNLISEENLVKDELRSDANKETSKISVQEFDEKKRLNELQKILIDETEEITQQTSILKTKTIRFTAFNDQQELEHLKPSEALPYFRFVEIINAKDRADNQLRQAMIAIHRELAEDKKNQRLFKISNPELFESLELEFFKKLDDNFALMRQAIEAGADVNLEVRFKAVEDLPAETLTPIFLAIVTSDFETLVFLFNTEKVNFNHVYSNNDSLLDLVATNNNIVVFFFFALALEDHPNKKNIINSRNSRGALILESLALKTPSHRLELNDFSYHAVLTILSLSYPSSIESYENSFSIENYKKIQIRDIVGQTPVFRVIGECISKRENKPSDDKLSSLLSKISELYEFKNKGGLKNKEKLYDGFIINKVALVVKIAEKAVEKKDFNQAHNAIKSSIDYISNNKQMLEYHSQKLENLVDKLFVITSNARGLWQENQSADHLISAEIIALIPLKNALEKKKEKISVAEEIKIASSEKTNLSELELEEERMLQRKRFESQKLQKLNSALIEITNTKTKITNQVRDEINNGNFEQVEFEVINSALMNLISLGDWQLFSSIAQKAEVIKKFLEQEGRERSFQQYRETGNKLKKLKPGKNSDNVKERIENFIATVKKETNKLTLSNQAIQSANKENLENKISKNERERRKKAANKAAREAEELEKKLAVEKQALDKKIAEEEAKKKSEEVVEKLFEELFEELIHEAIDEKVAQKLETEDLLEKRRKERKSEARQEKQQVVQFLSNHNRQINSLKNLPEFLQPIFINLLATGYEIRLKGSAVYSNNRRRIPRDLDIEISKKGLSKLSNEELQDNIRHQFGLTIDSEILIHRKEADLRGVAEFTINCQDFSRNLDFSFYDLDIPPNPNLSWVINRESKIFLYPNGRASPKLVHPDCRNYAERNGKNADGNSLIINPNARGLILRLCFLQTIGVIRDAEMEAALIEARLNPILIFKELKLDKLEPQFDTLSEEEKIKNFQIKLDNFTEKHSLESGNRSQFLCNLLKIIKIIEVKKGIFSTMLEKIIASEERFAAREVSIIPASQFSPTNSGKRLAFYNPANSIKIDRFN